MSKAPERIWAEPGMPGYLDKPHDLYTVEYVRADCVDALIATAYDKGIRDDPVNYYPPKKTRAALDALLKAERERIASIVETWRNDVPMTGKECAAALRALISKEKTDG